MSEPKQYFPDYDARWKILIDDFAEATIQKFYPNIAADRDFSKPIKFVEKEFQKLSPDWVKKGWTIGDKLMEVFVKNGKKKIVLLHFDVHKSHDTGFKELMWRRAYRIMDKYMDSEFTATAIYLSKTVPPESDRFIYNFEGTEINYIFNAFEIRNQKEAELLVSDNPLDIAILAMFYIIKAGQNFDLLRQYKTKVARLCLERGYSKREITKLLIFVEYSIALPREEEIIFKKEIKEIMKEKEIPMKEQDPIGTATLEEIFFGATLEERDEERNKKQIIRHHQFGIAPDKISLLLELNAEFVEKTIFEFEQQKDK